MKSTLVIQLANGSEFEIPRDKFQVDINSGCLAVYDDRRALVRAFGPGAWLNADTRAPDIDSVQVLRGQVAKLEERQKELLEAMAQDAKRIQYLEGEIEK